MTEERISVDIVAGPPIRRVLAAAYVLAAIVLAFSLDFGWMAVSSLVLLAAAAALTFRKLDAPARGDGFEVEADASCKWRRSPKTGYQDLAGTLRTDTTALSGLIVLRFGETGTRKIHSLILTPRCLHPDDWRRLQVFLRWGVRFDAAAGAPSAGRS